jgi:hypothetical protein
MGGRGYDPTPWTPSRPSATSVRPPRLWSTFIHRPLRAHTPGSSTTQRRSRRSLIREPTRSTSAFRTTSRDEVTRTTFALVAVASPHCAAPWERSSRTSSSSPHNPAAEAPASRTTAATASTTAAHGLDAPTPQDRRHRASRPKDARACAHRSRTTAAQPDRLEEPARTHAQRAPQAMC